VTFCWFFNVYISVGYTLKWFNHSWNTSVKMMTIGVQIVIFIFVNKLCLSSWRPVIPAAWSCGILAVRHGVMTLNLFLRRKKTVLICRQRKSKLRRILRASWESAENGNDRRRCLTKGLINIRTNDNVLNMHIIKIHIRKIPTCIITRFILNSGSNVYTFSFKLVKRITNKKYIF